MRSIFLVCLFTLFAIYSSPAQDWELLSYDPAAAGLEENPNRGLVPGFPGERNFPYSTEFFYLPLNSTMLDFDTYDWSVLEAKLESIADDGNTSVMRFMMDYPAQEIATPQFLIDAGVQMNAYTEYGNQPGQSLSPDYNDPLTMTALLNFVAAFGAAYDGDPRIAFVQAGLVGFWGEWHNYPLGDELGMNQANKQLIMQAFIDAFPNTELNFREPQWDIPTAVESQVGYHDDSFCFATTGPEEWHFWLKMIASDLDQVWLDHPIGGEIYPPLGQDIWSNYPNTVGQDWEATVQATHASYMLNHAIFDDEPTSVSFQNALQGSALLGYRLHADAVRIDTFSANQLDVSLRLNNTGVAPFYYAWPVEFAVQDEQGDLIVLGTETVDLKQVTPGGDYTLNFSFPLSTDHSGSKLLFRIVNPLGVLKPNAKPFTLANAEQHADLQDWLTLTTLNAVVGCPADLDGSGSIFTSDMVILLGQMGCIEACSADLNNDGEVSPQDLIEFLAVFGTDC